MVTKKERRSLLGVDSRAARYTWTAALVLLAMCTVYLIRDTVLVFVIALLFAYLLYPFMDLMDRHLPGRTRIPALAITFAVVIGIVTAFGVFVGSVVADQATSLVQQAPALIEKLRTAPAPGPAEVTSLRSEVLGWIEGQIRQHTNDVAVFAPKVALSVLSASRNLIYLVLIPILSFLLLRDGRAILAGLLEMIEARYQTARDTLSDVHELLLLYMRSLLFLCCTVFVTFSIVLSAMGVPYSMLLASIAFALEFIPLVGPLTAAAIIIGVSIVGGFGHIVWLIVFLGVFRLIQDYVVSPALMSKGVELHPLMIIFGVLAGGEIGGVAGIFLSIPMLALIRLFYHQLKKAHALEKLRIES